MCTHTSCTHSLYKDQVKGIKDLNSEMKLLFLADNMDTGFLTEFLGVTPKASAIKAKTNGTDYINLKSFCTVKKVKRWLP